MPTVWSTESWINSRSLLPRYIVESANCSASSRDEATRDSIVVWAVAAVATTSKHAHAARRRGASSIGRDPGRCPDAVGVDQPGAEADSGSRLAGGWEVRRGVGPLVQFNHPVSRMPMPEYHLAHDFRGGVSVLLNSDQSHESQCSRFRRFRTKSRNTYAPTFCGSVS